MKEVHSHQAFLYTEKSLIDLENIDLVIFDLDGTLLDSLDQLTIALNFALETVGSKAVDPAIIKTNFCYGTKSLLTDFVGANPGLHSTIYKHYTSKYLQIMYDSPLFDGAIDLLDALEGLKKMAILTNKREQTSKTLLKRFAIDKLFAPIVGGDTLSVKKPSPIPIEHICKHLNISPSRTLMVGDSHADINAGKAAGSQTIGVLNGFTTPEMVRHAKPDLLLPSIKEMLDLIPGKSGQQNPL